MPDTDLAEALMMQNNGQAKGEVADLLHKAQALDSHHVRSAFYLAAQAMRDGDYAGAVKQWNAIIALGKGDEPWMATAKAGLAAAEAGRDGKPLPTAGAPSAADAANPPKSPAILTYGRKACPTGSPKAADRSPTGRSWCAPKSSSATSPRRNPRMTPPAPPTPIVASAPNSTASPPRPASR